MNMILQLILVLMCGRHNGRTRCEGCPTTRGTSGITRNRATTRTAVSTSSVIATRTTTPHTSTAPVSTHRWRRRPVVMTVDCLDSQYRDWHDGGGNNSIAIAIGTPSIIYIVTFSTLGGWYNNITTAATSSGSNSSLCQIDPVLIFCDLDDIVGATTCGTILSDRSTFQWFYYRRELFLAFAPRLANAMQFFIFSDHHRACSSRISITVPLSRYHCS